MSRQSQEEKEAFGIINDITRCILKVVDIYENFKQAVSEDINYLNDIDQRSQKIMKIFRSPDVPKEFLIMSDELAKKNHPVGLSFSLFYDSFQKTSGLIEKKIETLDDLKNDADSRILHCQEFTKNIETSLTQSFEEYFETFTQTSDSRESSPTGINQILNKEDSFDNTLHEHFLKVLQTIGDQEILTKSLVESLLNFFKSLIREEKDCIDEISEEINSHFSLLCRETERKERPNESGKNILNELSKLYFNLKSFTHLHSMPKHHLIPSKWTDDQPKFSARVWSDYNAVRNEEVSVKKREMIDVLKATAHPYWLIKKTNDMEGYVPCTILELVE